MRKPLSLLLSAAALLVVTPPVSSADLKLDRPVAAVTASPARERQQVADAVRALGFTVGAVVPAGEGDGEFRETVRAFYADGFDGFVSLEPHLGYGHSLGGFSGPENWRRAHAAFTRILDEEGIAHA